MIDPDALNVWFEDRLVGYLWRNPIGAIGFRYEPDWINTGGFAVSRTLPLATEDFSCDANVAHRFFANLLPEGGVRDHIVRDLKIPNTDFDLLRAIGGECAGALSILAVEHKPSEDRSYRPLPNEELARLVARRGQIYATWPKDKRPRLSLAGAQDKCPVLIRDGHYFLPEGEAPTSHILKFELTDYRHLPAYETFTSWLAGQIGLPVVDIELHSIEKRFYAQIERYDRAWDASSEKGGEVQRLHQEDFCQALGYGFEKKYQDSGGPTFADCYQLLQDASTDPAIDTQNLLRWQIFNVLAGNSDGHAKNLSLLYLPNGEIRLAPFYDLVCTRAIERIDYHLAFDVGGQRDPGQITTAHWDTLARQCDVAPRFLGRLLQETAASLLEQIAKTKALFEDNTVIIRHCNTSSVWSHSNATEPPEFKTARVLDTLENPDQDRANRASARIRVEREWNAAKLDNLNVLFYLINFGVSREVQVLGTNCTRYDHGPPITTKPLVFRVFGVSILSCLFFVVGCGPGNGARRGRG